MNQLIARKRSSTSDEQLSASSFNRPIPEVIRDSLADSDPISRMARFTEALSGLNPNNTKTCLNNQVETPGGNSPCFAPGGYPRPAAMDYIKNNQRRGWDGMQNPTCMSDCRG